MANALLITDFAKNQQNSTWAAREFNPATDMAASQNFAIEVLQGVFDELETEMRENNNTWLLKRQAANYPVRTATQKIALGHRSRHGAIVTNKAGLQSYLKDGKVVTFAGQPKKITDLTQMSLNLNYLEVPEDMELDIDRMREKYLAADTARKRTYWLNIGNFAVMLNTLKTQQEVAAVELPTDPFLNLRYAELKAKRLDQVPGEHQLICNPDFSNQEGIFAVTEHLGECFQPKPFIMKNNVEHIDKPVALLTIFGKNTLVTNEEDHQTFIDGNKIFTITGKQLITKASSSARHMSGTSGITNLDKQIYYESQFTGQGEPVMPHEDRSKRAWYLYAGGIKKKFTCTTEQASQLFDAFQTIGINEKMANEFAKWINGTSVEQAVEYFTHLASDLDAVSSEFDDRIIGPYVENEPEDEHPVDADHPADIIDVRADAWHKLDDPRDYALTWESRQSKEFKFMLEIIRTASLPDLKIIGVALFKEKRHLEIFSKTQKTVIWDEFNRAKARRTPKLRKLALNALARLADPKVNLAKVRIWLHGDGKKRLNAHELSVVWDAWKKCRKAYAPKQSVMNVPEIPLEYYQY